MEEAFTDFVSNYSILLNDDNLDPAVTIRLGEINPINFDQSEVIFDYKIFDDFKRPKYKKIFDKDMVSSITTNASSFSSTDISKISELIAKQKCHPMGSVFTYTFDQILEDRSPSVVSHLVVTSFRGHILT